MTNMKRWLICAFLFLICYIIVINLDGKKLVEGLGGHGRGGHGRGGYGRGGYGRGGYGRGGYGRGLGGPRGYYGGYYPDITPVYLYDNYTQPYWYRYIPFFNNFY